MKTIVGLYDYLSDARDVIDDLAAAGISRDDISLLMADPDGRYGDDMDTPAEEIAETAAEGAAIGGVLGGIGGLLLGLGVFAIPGVGPIVAAGPLTAALTGAGVGALAGGLVGALVGWGIPEEEADYYAEGVRRGGKLVAVKIADSLVDTVSNIMNRYDPVNVDKRAAFWRADGWTEYDNNAEPYNSDQIKAERDRYLSFDEAGYGNYSESYQQHYRTRYAHTGNDYNYYDPAYRYGYTLATDDNYSGYSSWDEFETKAERRWRDDYDDGQSTWEEIKEAARHAWEETKDAFSDDDDDYDTSYRSRFENHYNHNYVGSTHSYDDYDYAYRYGHDLARRDDYRNRSWDEIETDAHNEWNDNQEDSIWEDFKEAVQHAWEETKDAFSRDEAYETTYRPAYEDHYRTNVMTNGYNFAHYDPAYRYGYNLAYNPAYHGNTWNDIEPHARHDWDTHHAGTWEEFKDSVQYAWMRVKQTVS